MAYGDTKIVINSITYDNNANNILIGIRNHPETEDSQTADVVLDNSTKDFTALNLRGLAAVISYDYGAGYVATAPLKVITQDDITSNGRLQTVLQLVGIPDLLAEDKASKDYIHDSTDTKTVKSLITEVLSGQPVTAELTVSQATTDSFYNVYDGSGLDGVGQTLFIMRRTVKSIQFYLKKVGSPTGNITFYMKPTSESWTSSKILGNASALTTSGVWYTATLDTAKFVEDEVYIYCEYTGGSSSNYICVGYNSTAVISDQNLVKLSAYEGFNQMGDQDCGYKYTYDIAGVDCWARGTTPETYCTSYTATITDDTLIDVYTPGNSFKISEGESRLDVLNRLLGYTGCVKRVNSAGVVLIFPPTISGTTYDAEYTTEVGHNLYSNAKRKALVIPNRIVVKSQDFEDDAVKGAATSAASFALLPISSYLRTYVTNSTQANAVAAAMIARLEIGSQVGSATVPMEVAHEVWNYIKITNTWQGDTNIGNISYLNRQVMGGRFQMFFSFGRQGKRGIAGIKTQHEVRLEKDILDKTQLTWEMIKGLFGIIDENTDDIYERLNLVFSILTNMGVKVDYLDRGVTFEWVYQALLDSLANYYSSGESDSLYGTRGIGVIAVDATTDLSVADGKAYIPISTIFNGMNLIRAQAIVNTAGTTNATTIDIYNVTDSQDMLSGAISIASGATVGTVGTINATYDDVATNDVLRVDVTTMSSVAPKGLLVVLEFQLP